MRNFSLKQYSLSKKLVRAINDTTASHRSIKKRKIKPSHYYVHCFIYNVYIIIFYGIKELKIVFHECHLAVAVVATAPLSYSQSTLYSIHIYIYKYVWICSLEKSHVSHIYSAFPLLPTSCWNLWILKRSMLGFVLSKQVRVFFVTIFRSS